MSKTWRRRLITVVVLGAAYTGTVLAAAADAKWMW